MVCLNHDAVWCQSDRSGGTAVGLEHDLDRNAPIKEAPGLGQEIAERACCCRKVPPIDDQVGLVAYRRLFLRKDVSRGRFVRHGARLMPRLRLTHVQWV